MIIRTASESDIPAIVSLLRQSLGESLMPKSQAFWNWKHIENPFGKSPVFLALDGDDVIGVRAFMRWEWTDHARAYRAVRAVDTATHPLYQGKGIFKKLTLDLVDHCQKEGIDFVFNTPNKSSMPGYLKMGWRTMGRLPVQAKVHLMRVKGVISGVADNWNSLDKHPLLEKHTKITGITTSVSSNYLRWRYQHNPNVKYTLLTAIDNVPYILVFRERRMRRLTEIRVTELIAADRAGRKRALSDLSKLTSGGAIITLGRTMDSMDILHGFVSVPAGPLVTTRNLNLNDWPECLNFARWYPSLGDMELF